MNKENTRRIFFTGAALIVLAFLLFKFTDFRAVVSYIIKITAPFLLGGGMALGINVLMSRIERLLTRLKPKSKSNLIRFLAFVLALVISLGSMVFIIVNIIPELAKVGVRLADDLPVFIQEFFTWAENHMNKGDNIAIYKQVEGELVKWSREVQGDIKNISKNFLVGSLNVLSSTISGVATLFLAFIFSVYLLFYKDQLVDQVNRFLYTMFPKEKADLIYFSGKRFTHYFDAFILGQIVEAFVFGGMSFVAMLIMRVPLAGTIAMFLGLTSLIPYFGGFIGIGVGAILVSGEGLSFSLIFALVIVIFLQIEGNLIYPRLMGERLGLPGIWVMLGVTLGLATLGLVGMIIAVPTATFIYDSLGDYLAYKSKLKALGQDKDLKLLAKVVEKSYYDKVK